MTRINQRLVPKVEYPALLMHSTQGKFSIGLFVVLIGYSFAW